MSFLVSLKSCNFVLLFRPKSACYCEIQIISITTFRGIKTLSASRFSSSMFFFVCVFVYSASATPSAQDVQRQHSIEAQQLYRNRRHISQDDTISISPSITEEELASREERRVTCPHHFIIDILLLTLGIV